jgi:feruloyl esterase
MLGKAETEDFARLYTAPGVDHVGSGAPANVDMLSVLVDWEENGQAPGDLEVKAQKVEAPSFATVRALPLCRWPASAHYTSGRSASLPASFVRLESSYRPRRS